ncbi:MAG: UbiA prenyltransferase family protein [Planctomycetes bacterium]|nr:UbiA prenyltransferase family protein [Planctomycetota bacterium]
MICDYIRIARPNHWFKNVFMVPGIILAWLACPPENIMRSVSLIILGLVATCLVCSSNYSINEILDSREDRNHPNKKSRPAASGRINSSLGYMQWAALGFVGLSLAWFVSLPFFLAETALFVMGIVYNVRPLRSKDWPYLDVLSESINNPLRLLLGWYSIGFAVVPPVSLLLSYWMMGAYFMAIKRFAEIRHLNDSRTATSYRRSFAYYTQERLLTSIVFYTTTCGLFGGIFLIRYRIELILAIPFLGAFMAEYLRLGFQTNSPAQSPEGLYKQKVLMAYVCVVAIVMIFCFVVDLPWLSALFESTLPHGFN